MQEVLESFLKIVVLHTPTKNVPLFSCILISILSKKTRFRDLFQRNFGIL